MEANFFQVSPSSPDKYKPGTLASTIESNSDGLEGLMEITIRPNSPSGKPSVSFFHVFPPSTDLKSALPFPPETNEKGCLLNCQKLAKIILGSRGLCAISAQPVFSSTYKILFHVFPASLLSYKPRCLLEDQSGPGTATNKCLLSLGFIKILLMCSVLSSPSFCQLAPASVDL